MDWVDIIIDVPKEYTEAASAIALSVSDSGLYIEDYTDLEQQVMEIAHVDLIEADLLEKPRDRVKIHIYISPEENPIKYIENLQAKFIKNEIPYKIDTNNIAQENWETAWKQYYHPIEIGKRLAICPTWEEYTGNRIVIRLDPGMAFGTGTHETTVLCLEVLDEIIHGGEKMLDIGTGTGILALAALALGADSALGIDIDPVSVRVAKENAQINHIKNIQIEAGNLAAKAQGVYTIITANIVADAIIQLAPGIPNLLAETGVFIASGVIIEREQEVIDALQNTGLIIENIKRKNGWVAVVSKRKNK